MTSDSSGSFWRTVPGIMTAMAGMITAIAGLIVVLNQANLLPATAEPAASEEVQDIAGRWTADVTYPWGVALPESFDFRVEGGRVLGTATYLGSPRAIENGTIEGEHIIFSTRAEEILGNESRPYVNHYDGLITPRGIDFFLQDTRGGEPVEFTARREP